MNTREDIIENATTIIAKTRKALDHAEAGIAAADLAGMHAVLSELELALQDGRLKAEWARKNASLLAACEQVAS